MNFWAFSIDSGLGIADLVKKKIREGIPEALRPVIWPLVLNVSSKSTKRDISFTKLLTQELKPEDKEQILKDIERTYPENVLFQTKEGYFTFFNTRIISLELGSSGWVVGQQTGWVVQYFKGSHIVLLPLWVLPRDELFSRVLHDANERWSRLNDPGIKLRSWLREGQEPGGWIPKG